MHQFLRSMRSNVVRSSCREFQQRAIHAPVLAAFVATLVATPAPAQQLLFKEVSTTFNTPIGIDHHDPTNSVVCSVNYPSGLPLNFERILSDGTHVAFGTVSGFTDEVKIATIRPGAGGGFTVGHLFVGNGNDGEIEQLDNNGAPVGAPWPVSLPGGANGLVRSAHHDRTGVFGGDLVACTTSGQVWRIQSAGTTLFNGPGDTPLAVLNTHLEGMCTIPNIPAQYGPLAGRIVCGAELQGLLYAIDLAGTVTSFNFGVGIEDIDLIPTGQNFYGVNFGTSHVLGVAANEFNAMVGDILLTQEAHPGSGLFRLNWNGAAHTVTHLGIAPGSAPIGNWEHVTFSPAGLDPIAPLITPFCFGDGTAGACPCANNGSAGNGCANSTQAGGANLSATGNASLAADTVVLNAVDESPNSLSIFLQGSAEIAPAPFGDGLICIASTLRLFLVKQDPFIMQVTSGSAPSANSIPPSPATVHGQSAAMGDPLVAGSLRSYQVAYRDARNPAFCPSPTGGLFNITNGLRVTWAP